MTLVAFFVALWLVVSCSARPQTPEGWNPVREITKYGTDEIILVNEDSIDINGCVVGPDGSRNCPHGAFGAGGDRVTFRGNAGHRNTGSNGQAGPTDSQGLPTDPAAVTYLKQLEAYKVWEKQQEENNRRIAGLGAPLAQQQDQGEAASAGSQTPLGTPRKTPAVIVRRRQPARAPAQATPVVPAEATVPRKTPAVVVRRRLPPGARRQPAPAPVQATPAVTSLSREEVLAGEGQARLEAAERLGEAPVEYLGADGCIYGPSGQRVCNTGAYGSAGDATTFRGNVGHPNTGSNGNAVPIDENGIAYDPAARTYLRQLENYKKWEKQQEENNKRIIG